MKFKRYLAGVIKEGKSEAVIENKFYSHGREQLAQMKINQKKYFLNLRNLI